LLLQILLKFRANFDSIIFAAVDCHLIRSRAHRQGDRMSLRKKWPNPYLSNVFCAKSTQIFWLLLQLRLPNVCN
jgi:hypothetical protein